MKWSSLVSEWCEVDKPNIKNQNKIIQISDAVWNLNHLTTTQKFSVWNPNCLVLWRSTVIQMLCSCLKSGFSFVWISDLRFKLGNVKTGPATSSEVDVLKFDTLGKEADDNRLMTEADDATLSVTVNSPGKGWLIINVTGGYLNQFNAWINEAVELV